MASERELTVSDLLNEVYNSMEGSEEAMDYAERHNVKSASVLTVLDDEIAGRLAEHLKPRIAGKTVVEIGGGIGLLSLHMGMIAKRVYCIEANPMWSWSFAEMLLKQKPKNVSFLFGAADEFIGGIKGDVAVFCTHSGVDAMRLVCGQFAPVVIDVYTELIDAAPDKFDPVARMLRRVV